MTHKQSEYPDPYILPYGRVSEREARAAQAGKAATEVFIASRIKNGGPLAGLAAAAHIQSFAFKVMLQKSGVEPQEARSYYEVIATCIGHTLGIVGALVGELEPVIQS